MAVNKSVTRLLEYSERKMLPRQLFRVKSVITLFFITRRYFHFTLVLDLHDWNADLYTDLKGKEDVMFMKRQQVVSRTAGPKIGICTYFE